MSFSASSKDIRLEHGHILHAKCENTAGNFDDSYIDLDHHIGNTDGKPHSESSGCYCYLALGQGDLSTSAIYRDWPQITTHRHGATVARYKVFS